MKPTVSVIIPTLQEEEHLHGCLRPLYREEGDVEILVVDGGSTDGTVDLAQSFVGVRVLAGARGRAQQQNIGASEASGNVLWFLHADSVPPQGAIDRILETLENPDIVGGAFRFRIDGSRIAYRIIEWMVRFRSEWLHVPYGDQGLFCRKEVFDRLGGFPEVPIMEDLYFLRKLKDMGPIRVLPDRVLTCARRWEEQGAVRTTLRNWGLVVKDWFGFGPREKNAMQPAAQEDGHAPD